MKIGREFEDYGPDYASFSDGRIGPLVVIYADDLGAALLCAKEAGGKITKEIFSFPGGSRFHFTDPSGNELAAWSES